MRVRGSKRKSEDLDDRDDTPHRLVKLHGSSFGFLRADQLTEKVAKRSRSNAENVQNKTIFCGMYLSRHLVHVWRTKKEREKKTGAGERSSSIC
jgi:hypothetical protein